jgi:hypothetical protein
MNKTIGIIIGVLIAAVIVLAALGVFKSESREQLDMELVAFGQCLEEQGAIFYGAFWCPHCQNQKRMFGRQGSDALPYVECSTPDSQGQTEVCAEAGVESYPTWRFANGVETTGTQSIEALSENTECPITPAIAEYFEINMDQGESAEPIIDQVEAGETSPATQ